MAGGRIDYTIGFKTDNSGLSNLSNLLTQISVKAKLPGNEMDTGLQKAAGTARQLSDILDRAYNADLGTYNIEKFTQGLKQSGLTLNTVKSSLTQMGPQGAAAFNQLSTSILNSNTQLRQSSQLLTSMANTMANTVKWGIASSAINTFTNSVKKAFTFVKDLDTSLNNIRIVTGKSAEEMDLFADKANKAAKKLGATTKAYTDAALIYYQQGDSDAVAQAKADVTIKTANVTGQSASEVSEMLTAVWNGYKVSAEEAELYIDKLAAVAASTASDLEELSTGMSKVASAASMMGVDIDQLNAQLATIISVTREAPETIGTSLKTIYARISDIQAGLDGDTSLSGYTEEMAELGFSVLNAQGELRDMGDVIEEIGGKWNLMSREQQVSLAHTMAGTRQYSRLLALFDNWDKYNESLETSSEAMGTLNQQNEIYLQSTAGKLQMLKATQEGMYQDLLDSDMVHTGIDVLIAAMESLSKIVDNLGGGFNGIVTILMLIASIFHKQIGTALGNTIARQQQYRRLVEQAQQKQQALAEGTAKAAAEGRKLTAEEKALVKENEKVLEIAKQINAVKLGLDQEGYKDLTQQQEKIGLLEKELALLNEQKAVIQESKVFKNIDGRTTEGRILKNPDSSIEDVGGAVYSLKETSDTANSQLQQEQQILQRSLELKREISSIEHAQAEGKLTNLSADEQQLELTQIELDLERQIQVATKNGNKTEQERLEAILKLVRGEEEELALQQQGTEKTREAAKKSKEQYEAGQEYYNLLKKIFGVQQQQNNEQGKLNEKLEQAKAKAKAQLSVTGITSAFSTLAMSMNSIASLLDTVLDDSLSFSEKLGQSLTTGLMVLPMLISGMTKLSGVIRSGVELAGLSNSVTFAGTVIQKSKLKGLTTEKLIEEYINKNKEKGIILDESEATQQLINLGLLKADTEGKLINTMADSASIPVKERLILTVKKLNTALMSNPYMLIIVAIVALIAILAGLNKAEEKRIEKLTEENKKIIENENATQEAINTNLELYDSYLKLAEAYENNTASQEDMEKQLEELNGVIDDQILRVVELTGNYNLLTQAIKDAQLSDLTDKKASVTREKNAAAANIKSVITKEFSGAQGIINGTKYILDLDQGASGADDEKAKNILKDILGDKYDIAGGNKITVGNSPAEIAKLYKDLNNALVEMQNQGISTSAEIYTQTSSWLATLKESMDAYTAAVDDINDSQIRLKVSNDFDNIESFKTYYSKREELIKWLGTLEGNENKDRNELEKIAASYLTNVSSQADIYEDRVATASTLSQLLINEEDNLEVKGTKAYTDREEAIKGRQKVLQNYFLNNLSEEEMIALAKMDPSVLDLQISQLMNAEGSTLTYLDALKKVASFTSNEDNFNTKIYTSSISQETHDFLEDLDLTSDAFVDYARAIEKAYSESKKSAEIATDLASRHIQIQKGLKDLKESYSDWYEALSEGKENTAAYYEALNQLEETTKNVFGLTASKDFLTDKENLELMQKVADGDIAAFEKLREKLLNDYVLNIDITGSQEQVDDARKILNNFVDEFDGKSVELNTSIGNIQGMDEYIISLNDMLAKGQITADQANDILSSIGFHPTIDMIESTITIDDGTGTKQIAAVQIPQINSTDTIYTGTQSDTIEVEPPGEGKDYLEDDRDRYRAVNNELTKIENLFDEIGRAKDRAFGSDVIDKMNEQLQLLNREMATTKIKEDILIDERNELQEELAKKGILFNDDNEISNYDAIYVQEFNKLQNMIHKYNSMGETGREKYEEELEKAEEDFEKFKENLERYDEIVYSEIPEVQAAFEEAMAEAVDINMEKFKADIELKIDVNEFKKEWKEFQAKALFGEDNVFSSFTNAVNSLNDVIKSDGSGLFAETVERTQLYLDEYNKMVNGDMSRVFFNDQNKAMEAIREMNEMAREQAENIVDYIEEIESASETAFENILDLHDSILDTMEKTISIIEHEMEVKKLLYGDDTNVVQEIDSKFDTQMQNLESLRDHISFLNDDIKNINKEIDFDKWKEKQTSITEAYDELFNSVNEALETVSELLEAENKLILQNIENLLTNQQGWEELSEHWETDVELANLHLSSINKEYKLQKLLNQIAQDITKKEYDSLYAQKKINEFKNKELELLMKKDKLTEAELDRANKLYELTLLQIALEEARNNKSSMKLARDSQGNYTYQYVADENAIEKAQQDLADKQNEIYKQNVENTKNSIKEFYSVGKDMQSALSDLFEDEKYQEYLGKKAAGEDTTALGAWLNSQIKDISNNYGQQLDYYQQNVASNLNYIFKDLGMENVNLNNLSDKEREILLSEGINLQSLESITNYSKELLNSSLTQLEDSANIIADNYANNVQNILGTTIGSSASSIGEYHEVLDNIKKLNQSFNKELKEEKTYLMGEYHDIISYINTDLKDIKEKFTSFIQDGGELESQVSTITDILSTEAGKIAGKLDDEILIMGNIKDKIIGENGMTTDVHNIYQTLGYLKTDFNNYKTFMETDLPQLKTEIENVKLELDNKEYEQTHSIGELVNYGENDTYGHIVTGFDSNTGQYTVRNASTGETFTNINDNELETKTVKLSDNSSPLSMSLSDFSAFGGGTEFSFGYLKNGETVGLKATFNNGILYNNSEGEDTFGARNFTPFKVNDRVVYNGKNTYCLDDIQGRTAYINDYMDKNDPEQLVDIKELQIFKHPDKKEPEQWQDLRNTSISNRYYFGPKGAAKFIAANIPNNDAFIMEYVQNSSKTKKGERFWLTASKINENEDGYPRVDLLGNGYRAYLQEDSGYTTIAKDWKELRSILGFDTGGYTGAWFNGSKDGRLAMLHQKELVLNESDTPKVLDAVKAAREFSTGSIIKDFQAQIQATLVSLENQLLRTYTNIDSMAAAASQSASQMLEQAVHIDASFPGVKDAREIEEALNNLVNVASQYAYENN